MLLDLLQDYGFSPREAKIYLTCLEFGEDVVSSIARRAGENRVTTYSILKDLAQRGVANEVIKNKKKYYSVISPQKLLKKQEDKYNKLKEALPELMSITSEYAHKVKTYFFEGLDGIKEIYQDTLEYPNSEIWTISGKPVADDGINDFTANVYKPQRIKNKIFLKSIYPMSDKFKTDEKKNYYEIVFCEDELYDFHSDIGIYADNKVYIVTISKHEKTGMIIENQVLHNSLKSLFSIIRKTGKK